MSYKKVKLNHISRKALELGHTYTYAVYYQDHDNFFKKLFSANTSFSKETLQSIESLPHKELFVLSSDYHLYEKDTQEYISKIVDDPSISNQQKSEIIHDMASETVHELFLRDIRTSKIESFSHIINQTIQVILNDTSAIKAMLGVTSYDYYTYTHCVNVSIYALGFGAFLKLPKEDLMVLGRGGILHDLGKKNVPNEIVNKNGSLSDEEFAIMKKHSTYGKELLKQMGETNPMVMKIVEQHHEKLNGNGYPFGLRKGEIEFLAQIVTIADIFDALTTKRSYKPALRTFDALNIMKEHMSDELDHKLLAEFMIFMVDRDKFITLH